MSRLAGSATRSRHGPTPEGEYQRVTRRCVHRAPRCRVPGAAVCTAVPDPGIGRIPHRTRRTPAPGGRDLTIPGEIMDETGRSPTLPERSRGPLLALAPSAGRGDALALRIHRTSAILDRSQYRPRNGPGPYGPAPQGLDRDSAAPDASRRPLDRLMMTGHAARKNGSVAGATDRQFPSLRGLLSAGGDAGRPGRHRYRNVQRAAGAVRSARPDRPMYLAPFRAAWGIPIDAANAARQDNIARRAERAHEFPPSRTRSRHTKAQQRECQLHLGR